MQRGGRFNRPGSPALYASFKRITALREATHLLADDDPAIPFLMLTIEYDLGDVLDLTASTVTTVLGTTRAELTSPLGSFRSGDHPTQSLGAAAAAVGCDGLVAWSRADPRGKNLVIFTGRTTPGSFVVYDDPPRRFESFELVERGTIVPFRPRMPNE